MRKGEVADSREPQFGNNASSLLNLSAIPQLPSAVRPSPPCTPKVLTSGHFLLPHEP